MSLCRCGCCIHRLAIDYDAMGAWHDTWPRVWTAVVNLLNYDLHQNGQRGYLVWVVNVLWVNVRQHLFQIVP